MTSTPAPGRRAFLKTSLLGAALLAVAGTHGTLAAAAAVLGGQGPALPPVALKVFDAKQYATLHALLDRLLPASPTTPGASAVGLALRIDEEFSHWSSTDRRDLKQLLDLFEGYTWLSGFFDGPFTRLSVARQDAYMAHWMTSWIDLQREGFSALRSVAMVYYYADDASWPGTGYPGPFDVRFRKPAHDLLPHPSA